MSIEYRSLGDTRHLYRIETNIETARREIQDLPHGRARSLALTKIDEAQMWATKAIDDQHLEEP